ncbi:MAG: phosphate ABC transporter substrate-binding protein PstS [Burkholderiales bacterium]|jgi:phosphate transport system substrate-binding protein|nr:MAG: phosphate ABC transporter substrate-binding protein PstS [Burkholderiales bacterium]
MNAKANTAGRLLIGATLALGMATAQAVDITGAGATFPAPIYAKWAEAYKAATGTSVNYQGIGSGGGVKQIVGRTVDFGASDDPMKGEDLDRNALLQFPAVIGGIVAVAHLPGLQPGRITLDGPVLADIYRGTITKWNDARIGALNPGLQLPSSAITLVYRSDSSGTTAAFTDYLSQVSPSFRSEIGAGKTVNWKSGVGGKGNAGVAANVTKIAGSIGYVEYAYARQNGLAHAAMINRDGRTVQPNDRSFAAAAAHADWASSPGFGVNLNHQHGDEAWPMTSASYILVHRTADDPARSAEVLKFFRWALNDGRALALALDYVPLPAAVVEKVEASWAGVRDASGQPVLKSGY